MTEPRLRIAGRQEPASWERQPGEPDRAWAAFTTYRDLGPVRRSLTKAVQEGTDGGTPRGLSRVKEWSRRWSWAARAASWDAEADRRRRDPRVQEGLGELVGIAQEAGRALAEPS